MRCARQRSQPVGLFASTVALLISDALGRDLSAAAEQRRGTRKRNPLANDQAAPDIHSNLAYGAHSRCALPTLKAPAHSSRQLAFSPSSPPTAIDIHWYILEPAWVHPRGD